MLNTDSVTTSALPISAPMLAQERVEARHVVVRETHEPRLRQQRAVKEARVAQPVGEDEVALTDKRGDDAYVGLVAGVEDERGFLTLEGGYLALQLVVQLEVAAQEPRGRRADAVSRYRVSRRLRERRMRGEAEVVV